MRKSTENSFLEPAKYTWYESRSYNMNNERMAFLMAFFQGNTDYPTAGLNLERSFLLEGYKDEQFDTAIYRLKLLIRTCNNSYKYANSLDSIKKNYGMAFLKKKILLINNRDIHSKKVRGDMYEPDAFENYSYKVEFASSSKIEEIIKTKNKNYVLGVRILSDGGSGVSMYDVETGFYLGSFDKKGWPGAIRSKDVEILEEKINE